MCSVLEDQKVKKKDSPFQYDEWNKWTIKSSLVPYIHTKKGIGDGEEKLCAEYDVKPLGQNSSYDCKIEGIRCECKKLDSDNSFRVGISMLPKYTTIQNDLINILYKLKEIVGDTKITHHIVEKIYKLCFQSVKKSKSKTTIFQGILKSEICASNLNILNNCIEKLKKIVLFSESKKVRIYICSQHGKHKDVDFYSYLKLFYKENIIKDIMGEDYIISVLKIHLTDILLRYQHTTIKECFNNVLKETFENITLVFVDKHKGFYPVKDNTKLYCKRITSGSIRANYDFS